MLDNDATIAAGLTYRYRLKDMRLNDEPVASYLDNCSFLQRKALC